MGAETTEKDVTLADELEAAETETDKIPVISPRDAALESISKKRFVTLEEETPAESDSTETEKGEQEPEQKFEVVVDGKKEEVTLEELTTGFQKNKTASERLRQATELQKQVEADREKLLLEQEDLKNKSDAEEDTLYEDSDDVFDYEDFIQKIREGADDDALEAAKSFADNLRQNSGVSKESVTSIVERTLSERQEAERKALEQKVAEETLKARENFDEAFSDDIASNKSFISLAVMEDNNLAEDPEWADKPLQERFMKAGELARKWIKPESEDSIVPDKTQLLDIQSASAKVKTNREKKPKTRAEIIAEIKQGRGQ